MSDAPDLFLPHLRARGPQDRFRGIYPTSPNADPHDYTPDEDEFILAVAHFRSVNKISSPSLCQLLWVAKQIGYSKPPIQPGVR